MKIKFSKQVRKDLKHLNAYELRQMKERLQLFQKNPNHQKLENHQLKGKLKAFRSISITGDVRAWFTEERGLKHIVRFTRIGSHSQLYG